MYKHPACNAGDFPAYLVSVNPVQFEERGKAAPLGGIDRGGILVTRGYLSMNSAGDVGDHGRSEDDGLSSASR